MPSELERRAVQRLLDQARELGVPDNQIPKVIHELAAGTGPSCGGALGWVRLHPDDQEIRGCCWGEVVKGPEYCICWVPEYDVDQADPIMPEPGEIQVRPGGMCAADDNGRDGGCAYRPGSTEMQGIEADKLREMPLDGEVFFCHEGMRRPTRWRHRDGRVIPAHPADYQPPFVRGLPFRANGRVGYICAGWDAWSRRWTNQQFKEKDEPQ